MAVSDLPGEAPDPRKPGTGSGRAARPASTDIPSQSSLGRGSVRVAANLGQATSNPIVNPALADADRGSSQASRDESAVAVDLRDRGAQVVEEISPLPATPLWAAEVTEQPATQAVTVTPSRPVAEPGSGGEERLPERPSRELAGLVVRPAGDEAAAADQASRSRAPFRRRRPRVRRVRRVIRSIDTWTVFKVSLFFFLVAYAIALVAGVLLWNLAYTTGTIENIQEFFKDFGWDNYQFYGDKIFRASWIIGLFLVVAGTGMCVTLAVLFNLISDLVGGIGITVLEEEVRLVPVDTDKA